MTDLAAELAALRAELGRTVPLPPAVTPQTPGAGAELESMLGELRDTLAEASDETREAIAGHPLMAVGAAFLLGVIVGRIAGRA